ncbi:MAG: hypothetical protein RLZZ371_2263 [Pseudomonadota bacterium]
MFDLVDLKRVRQIMGELAVFDYVASAFLGQLVAWRSDFARHSDVYDRTALRALVHKMKGSCQAVAALGVASRFEQAEREIPALQPSDWPPIRANLEEILSQLETEIRGIMARKERANYPPVGVATSSNT